jgi:hypothetical protein
MKYLSKNVLKFHGLVPAFLGNFFLRASNDVVSGTNSTMPDEEEVMKISYGLK